MAKFKDFYSLFKEFRSSFKDSRSSSDKGWILFFTILGTVFWVVAIISKMIGTSDSSWWWILAPLWIPWAIFFVMLLVTGVATLYKELRK